MLGRKKQMKLLMELAEGPEEEKKAKSNLVAFLGTPKPVLELIDTSCMSVNSLPL